VLGYIQGFVSEGSSMFIISRTTNKVFLNVEGDMTTFVHPFYNVPHLAHNFWADAITWQEKHSFIRTHSSLFSS
jgi:hypothetical protein